MDFVILFGTFLSKIFRGMCFKWFHLIENPQFSMFISNLDPKKNSSKNVSIGKNCQILKIKRGKGQVGGQKLTFFFLPRYKAKMFFTTF